MRISLSFVVLTGALLFSAPTLAETPEFALSIKDHAFTPAELTVPADTKIALRVKNEDASAEEFESHDLNREKIIKGGKEAVIKLGPLKPGTYKFFGEFHPKTAQGVLVVK